MYRTALETHPPYPLLALTVPALFYDVYFIKRLRQKRRGIQPRQSRRRKEKSRSYSRNTDAERRPCHCPGTAGIDHVGLELLACQRPVHRLLHRAAGGRHSSAFRALYAGQLAGGHPG